MGALMSSEFKFTHIVISDTTSRKTYRVDNIGEIAHDFQKLLTEQYSINADQAIDLYIYVAPTDTTVSTIAQTYKNIRFLDKHNIDAAIETLSASARNSVDKMTSDLKTLLVNYSKNVRSVNIVLDFDAIHMRHYIRDTNAVIILENAIPEGTLLFQLTYILYYFKHKENNYSEYLKQMFTAIDRDVNWFMQSYNCNTLADLQNTQITTENELKHKDFVCEWLQLNAQNAVHELPLIQDLRFKKLITTDAGCTFDVAKHDDTWRTYQKEAYKCSAFMEYVHLTQLKQLMFYSLPKLLTSYLKNIQDNWESDRTKISIPIQISLNSKTHIKSSFFNEITLNGQINRVLLTPTTGHQLPLPILAPVPAQLSTAQTNRSRSQEQTINLQRLKTKLTKHFTSQAQALNAAQPKINTVAVFQTETQTEVQTQHEISISTSVQYQTIGDIKRIELQYKWKDFLKRLHNKTLNTVPAADLTQYEQYLFDHWLFYNPELNRIEASFVPVDPSAQHINFNDIAGCGVGNQNGAFYFDPRLVGPIDEIFFQENMRGAGEDFWYAPGSIKCFTPQVEDLQYIHNTLNTKTINQFKPLANICCAAILAGPITTTTANSVVYATADELHADIEKYLATYKINSAIKATACENIYLLYRAEGLERLQILLHSTMGKALITPYFSKFEQLDYFVETSNHHYANTLEALTLLEKLSLEQKTLFMKLMSNIGFSRQPLDKLVSNFMFFVTLLNGLDDPEHKGSILSQVTQQLWQIPKSGIDPAVAMSLIYHLLADAKHNKCLQEQIDCLEQLPLSGVRILAAQQAGMKFIAHDMMLPSIDANYPYILNIKSAGPRYIGSFPYRDATGLKEYILTSRDVEST